MKANSLSKLPSENGYQRPFLKYAGNKFQLLPKILPLLPDGQRLIEPFAGSCVVSLNARKFSRVWANDVNPDLIGMYNQVCDPNFIQRCAYLFSSVYNNENLFRTLKGNFNAGHLQPLDRAAVFLYFNRHCYNGLVRYNSKRKFNTSFGRIQEPYFPRAEIEAFQSFAQRAIFTALDWSIVMDQAQPGDVVYCDPPYIPVSNTAKFTSYAGNMFGADDARRLNEMAAELRDRGIPVIISNSNTPTTLACFSAATRVIEVTARRSISCKADKRGMAEEVILIY